jgi:carbonic anhydrase
VGHTRCGGVRAALEMANSGPEKPPSKSTALERWLTPIALLAKSLGLPNDDKYWLELVKENIKAQVRNVKESAPFKEAARKRKITIQGWIYGLEDGLLKVLDA